MFLENMELIRPNLISNIPQETLTQGCTLGAWVAEQLELSCKDDLLSGLPSFLPSGRVWRTEEHWPTGLLATWTDASP